MGTYIATQWRRGSKSILNYTRIASSGHMDYVYCETIDNDPFGACLHAWHYITESCFNSLNDSEKAKARSRYGIVKDSGWAKPYKVDQWTYYTFDETTIVECFNTTCFNLRPDLRCEGVVCDDICINADKYSQACVTEGENAGECAIDQLIEANSPDCPGYDSCKDVVCEDKCYEYDLHGQVCEDGICIKGILIEADNREICGYDPCKDVVCEDKCYGVDKYSNVCEEGVCVVGQLVEPNSTDCGYVPPDPDPEPDKFGWEEYVLIGVALVLFYLLATRG